MIVGFFINNEVSGWSLSTIDLLGSLCIATGAFLFVISILGVMAARTHHITFMFAYFILTLLLVSAIGLAVVYALVETEHISTYLEENWEDIEAIICAKDICDLTYDEANELIHRYFYVLVGVGITAVAMQLVTLFSAMRMLGLKAIAISCLITIGLLGCAQCDAHAWLEGDRNFLLNHYRTSGLRGNCDCHHDSRRSQSADNLVARLLRYCPDGVLRVWHLRV
eukprot:CAMPEP_0113296054 /NCGR_PEP_ID=MMETSP0008_2-20120614/36792_1 /TAXON_ID=97485 /ORGANISM="Prymnesium parvum" /LENGTH=223 /DNA_ID=CAMNT_0000148837 /DNA_START=254 /DNA_END=925 /DNA_ORIENTATION=+ /assembly_acc=CAM_ASM_000153